MSHLLQPLTRLTLALLSALAPLSLSGCMPPEQPAAPKARLRVVHADPQLGSVEVLVNEQVVLTVAPGKVSDEVAVNVGDWALSFRNVGAAQAIVTTEVLPFEERLSVVALTDGEGDERLLLATEEPPAAEEGTHHLRVLDLSGRAAPTKVFHGLTHLLDLPVEGRLSPFLAVEPSAAAAALALSDAATGAPLLSESPQLTLGAGGATFLVAQESATEPGLVVLSPFSIR